MMGACTPLSTPRWANSPGRRPRRRERAGGDLLPRPRPPARRSSSGPATTTRSRPPGTTGRVLRRRPDLLRPGAGPRGNEFQRKVWQLLTTIPYGQTRTYGQLAAQLGDPVWPGRSGRPMAATPCPSWCPATGWSVTTGRSPAMPGGWPARRSCCSWNSRPGIGDRRCSEPVAGPARVPIRGRVQVQDRQRGQPGRQHRGPQLPVRLRKNPWCPTRVRPNPAGSRRSCSTGVPANSASRVSIAVAVTNSSSVNQMLVIGVVTRAARSRIRGTSTSKYPGDRHHRPH